MTEFTEARLTFEVDFNNTAAGGRLVKTSLRRWPGRIPAAGERVFLRDADDNTCWAYVERVTDPMIFFEPDDSTWVSGGPETVQASGQPALLAIAGGV
jgi:hypothetical protein